MSARITDESLMLDGNRDTIKIMQDAFNKNSQANQSYWTEGTKDVRFKIGDSSIWQEFYNFSPQFNNRNFNFNRLRKIINLVVGHQRRNRKITQIMGRDGEDDQTADQRTKVQRWADNQMNTYHTISDAFEGALTTGMNLLTSWMDYSQDPKNGDIKLKNLSYNGYMIDSFFRKKDLSDCNFVWTRKYLAKEQVAFLLPSRRSDIMMLRGGSGRDDKFTFLPENVNIQNPDLLSYDEFWQRDYRKATILIDSFSGEVIEFNEGKDTLNSFMRSLDDVTRARIQIKTITKPTVKLSIVVQNQVMFEKVRPYKSDKFPFIPVFGYFEPDSPFYEWKIQGMIRGLRDAQFLYNRLNINILDIFESQINSGLKVLEGSLVDPNDAFKSGQGQVLFVKKQELGLAAVEQIPPPAINPALFQAKEQMGVEILEDSGINEELMGSADDDKAGILAMLRQGAGLTTLQTFFDNLDQSQKLLGELHQDYIANNFTEGKVRKIVNEDPTPQFFDSAFNKFDAIVTEGALTESQRKTAFMTLLEMQKIGIQIPPEILIDKAPIPEKKDLLEAINQQQKAAQEAQQQQMQLDMAKLQAEIELAKTQSAANVGLAKERMSRSLSNLSLSEERRSEAIKDLNQSELDKVKAIKELQGIDLNQIQQAVDILNSLKEQQAEEVKEVSPLNIQNQLGGAVGGRVQQDQV